MLAELKERKLSKSEEGNTKTKIIKSEMTCNKPAH